VTAGAERAVHRAFGKTQRMRKRVRAAMRHPAQRFTHAVPVAPLAASFGSRVAALLHAVRPFPYRVQTTHH
jgi:hypothetical protein